MDHFNAGDRGQVEGVSCGKHLKRKWLQKWGGSENNKIVHQKGVWGKSLQKEGVAVYVWQALLEFPKEAFSNQGGNKTLEKKRKGIEGTANCVMKNGRLGEVCAHWGICGAEGWHGPTT